MKKTKKKKKPDTGLKKMRNALKGNNPEKNLKQYGELTGDPRVNIFLKVAETRRKKLKKK